MKRREFITLVSGAAAWPVVGRAQQNNKPKRIAFMSNGSGNLDQSREFVAIFEESLKKLGWRVGDNLVIDYRWNGTTPEAMFANAAELFALSPDMIVARTTLALTVAQRATKTIPIVFLSVSDPVEQGFIENPAHPGGNVTGFIALEFSIGGKLVDLLKQAQPQLGRVAYVYYPAGSPQYRFMAPSIEAAAKQLGLEYLPVPIGTHADIEPALAGLAKTSNTGFAIGQDNFLTQNSKEIVDIAARFRLPAVYANREFASAGGLIVYSYGQEESYRGVAIYADRILKGTPAGDLPLQLPTRFNLAINLTAAKALGVEFSLGLMIRADEVIE